MKYTIEGFNQEKAIKLGLDCKDLVFLRWMVDFYSTGMMDTKVIDGQDYFWISYHYVMRELPILGINSGDALGRRMKAMSSILDFKTIATSKGNRIYCSFKKTEMLSLITKNTEPPDPKVGWVEKEDSHPTQKSGGCPETEPPDPKVGWMPTQKSGGCRPKSRVEYDSSINDSSINDSIQPDNLFDSADICAKPVENSKTTHSDRFLTKAEQAKGIGFNIFQMVNKFYKESKLIEPLPEEVLEAVLDEYLQRELLGIKKAADQPWPYFIRVLHDKSRKYFAEKNDKEGKGYKKEPSLLADILSGIVEHSVV